METFQVLENVRSADANAVLAAFQSAIVENTRLADSFEVSGWIKIIDDQVAAWASVSNGQTPGWSNVNDSHNPNWQNINN
jgi:hypothetical protein